MEKQPLLKNKIALITGAGSGIGKASAFLFAREGATVIVADIDATNGQQTADEIGGETIFIQTDVSKKDDIENLVSQIIEKHQRLDCAFNNAGLDGPPAPIIECPEKDWNKIVDINLKGTFFLMKYEIEAMLKQAPETRNCSIVNMSSVYGILGRANRGAYNASRHGIIGLTKTAALEYAARGIRVNAMAPGGIDTPVIERSTKGDAAKKDEYHKMHPIGRLGKPEEIAEAALWLCSEKSSFVVGHTLVADGGFSIQ
ncbi:MAG: glucose 1-dehydrogenase [bacterium]|nr:glucose 1-dehydrogenase [bacterium]